MLLLEVTIAREQISQEVSVAVENSEKNIGKFVTIKNEFPMWAWNDSKATEQGSTKALIGRTFKIKQHVLDHEGQAYYLLIDNEDAVLNYVKAADVQPVKHAGGDYFSYGKYVLVKAKDYDLWQNFNGKKRARSTDYAGRLLQARGYYRHFDGTRYLSLYDNQSKWIGYIDERGTELTSTGAGRYHPYGKYVTIESANYDLWQNFKWDKRGHSSQYVGQTFHARGYYDHFNGNRYVSLYDRQGQWSGYVNLRATKLATNGGAGNFHRYDKYVTIQSNDYDLWQNFNWQKRDHSSNYHKKVLHARGYYDHFNGSRYFSLYDREGCWVGYIDAAATKLSATGAGDYHSYGQQVTLRSQQAPIFENFSWRKRPDAANYFDRTVQARGYYNHFNGNRYFSLYENTGHWIGYIDEQATIPFNQDLQGTVPDKKLVVTMTEKEYTLWQNFDWLKKGSSNPYVNLDLEVKAIWAHPNGSTYLSLFNMQGEWLGYVNQAATNLELIRAHDAENEQKSHGRPVHVFVMGHGAAETGATANGTSEREFIRTVLLPKLVKYAA